MKVLLVIFFSCVIFSLVESFAEENSNYLGEETSTEEKLYKTLKLKSQELKTCFSENVQFEEKFIQMTKDARELKKQLKTCECRLQLY